MLSISSMGDPQGSDQASSTLPRRPRHTSSKYDFVKVRVWLGENSDHYYVLSRFLLSRMLTVTKIPNHVAIKISLELKKLLVDNSLLDVSQSDLEANLFKLMERRGYGEEYISRYKMITRFHHQRIPLIILVCGTPCVGKSTIATQLAQRLNLPNVLQTDMVYELLRTSTDAPLTSTPIWARDFASPEELVTEFCRECRIVRKGLDGDLRKAMKDGKPVIIEGMHLDPSIYIVEKEDGESISVQKGDSSQPESISKPDKDVGHCDRSEIEVRSISSLVVPRLENGSPSHKQKDENEEKSQGILTEPVKKGSPTAVVVPIVLRMADIDHQMLLEEWVASRSLNGLPVVEKEDDLMGKLKTIQDYLCSFEAQGVMVVDISATTFPQTLDWLHSYLLQCIERGCMASQVAG